ncbi:uncharacterized protein LOC115812613 [Chanos chanos]|uniref:Uncharacterized protein LOC115812613 n=1 Tax=Chanos chanos TaxID=29144 RepID=A0A6J2VI44_CHACN|nr:uncharacterized protein LOC115812613 [Chanos chanos]
MPAYKLSRDEGRSWSYLRPSSVYLYSDEVYRLLGTHVSYVDMTPSEFSRTIGMRNSVQVKDMVDYLKQWCTKVSDENQAEAEGAHFTTTIQHIHTVYQYLQSSCSPGQLTSLFQRSPAVFIEYERKDDWCSGKFYHLKEVCWSDPTGMFVRYKEAIRKSDGGVQEPRVLAPFYSHLPDMRELFMMILKVESHPSMKQYVDLLVLVCETSELPTGEVLQDVSIIFAKLANKCKIRVHDEQDHTVQLDKSYCTSLKNMVTDQRVFPTKNSGWVSLSRKPMIPDSTNLEKIFKSHRQVCLLNLPPAQKKTAKKTKQGKTLQNDERLTFSEEDRDLFLKICGVKRLSECVIAEALTENYRPCPAMQTFVRNIVPYVQRFIYHSEKLEEVYSELKENNISQQIKNLKFGQVGKLYINYRLDVPDGDPIFETEDIICLLKDKKELYVQKDNLSSKLDICRELVKLFSSENDFGKELEHFLGGLAASITDKAALKRFLDRHDIHELPSDEEEWEVPEPMEMKPEPTVPSAAKLARAVGAQEEERKTEGDGENTLVCWPPKSSFGKVGAGHTAQAVEAVMKMWPPPAPPSSGEEQISRGVSGHDRPGEPPLPRESGLSHPQGFRSSGSTNTSSAHSAALPHEKDLKAMPVVQPTDVSHMSSSGETEGDQTEPKVDRPSSNRTAPHSSSEDQHTHQPSQQNHKPAEPPEVVSSQFQGNGSALRPPMALDNAVWTKATAVEAVLEDLTLDCTLPEMVTFSEDIGDTVDIGEWGERLVHSFLTHWMENGGPQAPKEIVWYNQNGETGQPCDFKLTFAVRNGESQGHEVFVEVKTTVKREKHFIHLSANELDFALKEKERYHIYRVYSAGDSQNVRLCRIKNLAQHLHSKTLELFLFV